MTQQPKSSCHFLVLLTFDHLHSSMLLAYDNPVQCALEVHNGDRHGSFLDLFMILEEISLWLQTWPWIGYGVCSTPVSQPHSSFSQPFPSPQQGKLQLALSPSQTSLLWRYSQLNYFLLCILIMFSQRRVFDERGHHQASLWILALLWHLLEPPQAQGI